MELEVIEACTKIAFGKTPGSDGITRRFIKSTLCTLSFGSASSHGSSWGGSLPFRVEDREVDPSQET